jgi:hypothetical protein
MGGEGGVDRVSVLLEVTASVGVTIWNVAVLQPHRQSKCRVSAV